MCLLTVDCTKSQAKHLWKWQDLGVALCAPEWSQNPSAFQAIPVLL